MSFQYTKGYLIIHDQPSRGGDGEVETATPTSYMYCGLCNSLGEV